MKGLLRLSLINGVFCLCGVGGSAEALSSTSNSLTKFFYHQGLMKDTVVCYFDKEPVCNPLPYRKANKNAYEQKTEFFLPKTHLAGGQARTMMQKVNKIKRDNYSIQFSEEKLPIEGVKVSITYNPEKIDCEYAICPVISKQEGLVFSFRHKETRDLLENNTNSVLHLVYNTPATKSRVMLDFGHGGDDDGKVGCNKAKEKDITLQVGKKLVSLLKKKGYQVFLTRKSDIYVPLDERTTLANRCGADLFVSLHSNAGPENASGIETYWTGRTGIKHYPISKGDEQARAMFSEKWDEKNKRLADLLHQNVIKTISARCVVNDRKVKESVAQVLLGTDMPSALVEMGFLSNRKEADYLANSSYQLLLAQGISNGIDAYCKSLKLA